MAAPIRVLELRSARGAGGGPEKTILVGAARARRVDVTVCYLRDERDSSFTIGSRAQALGVDYVEIPERHSFDVSVWPALRRLIRDRGIDIVHTHEYKTDLLGLLLARAEGVRAMATVHGWIENTVRERVYGLFDRRLLARYPLVVAVSEKIRSTLIAGGAAPSRVRCLVNGVDPLHFASRHDAAGARRRLGLPADGFIIGSVGRLGPEKRFDLLLTAAARLSPAPVVAIAGEGPCGPALNRQAAELGLDLRLLGHQNDVRDVYDALDLFVQSSDTEGVPNAVLEAMAMELPVVATDVGGTHQILTDGVEGSLVPRRNVPALAAAICRTRKDECAARARVQAARRRIEQELSFDARTARLEQMYEELAARRPTGLTAAAPAAIGRPPRTSMRPPTPAT
jgi:glycosyltransferase involved in cell wall biosynthesis